MVEIDFSEKVALITGVANKWSIAWPIAQIFSRSGARLILSVGNEKIRKKVEKLTGSLVKKPLVKSCDVTSEEEILALFAQLKDEVGKLDTLVHSIAFAPDKALKSPFQEISWQDYATTLQISAYSLVILSREFVKVAKNDASIVALTYEGARRVASGYKVMGPAKATLEANIRYLASELGEKGMRINGISAGPIMTTAAKGIPGFSNVLKIYQEKSPLKRNITREEVAKAALFLSSELASGVTGEILHVDAGSNIML